MPYIAAILLVVLQVALSLYLISLVTRLTRAVERIADRLDDAGGNPKVVRGPFADGSGS